MLGSKIHLRTFPLSFLRSRGPRFEKEWRAFWNSSQSSKLSSFIRKLKGLWTIVIGKSRWSVQLDLLFCRAGLFSHRDLSFNCSILTNGKILRSSRPGNSVPWDLCGWLCFGATVSRSCRRNKKWHKGCRTLTRIPLVGFIAQLANQP
jgi:hypothetical protein